MSAFSKLYRGDKDIERRLLKVAYGRRVINDIDVYFVSVHRACREANLGTWRYKRRAYCSWSSIYGKARLLGCRLHRRRASPTSLSPNWSSNAPLSRHSADHA
jgi:hypothetical protein